jgi:hypothetical protein
MNTDEQNLKAHLDNIEATLTGKRKHIKNLIENALEINITYEGHPNTQPQATGTRTLLTYGGPNIQLTTHIGNEWATLTGNWAGTHQTRQIHTPKATTILNEIAEGEN